MGPLPYYTIMRQSKAPTYVRLELVRAAREHGVKPAARAFGTTPKTVRKWLGRWQPGSLRGLQDRSRVPKAPARRLPEEARQRALTLKRRLPSWGAARIKRDFDLPLSDKAIRRCWRDAGLLKRKRRKHHTKQDLRAIKAAWRLCEQMDIDTTNLIDIPELWPRSVSIGSLRSSTGMPARSVPSPGRSRPSPGSPTRRSPPAAHTWQADVETVHGLIEDEFYEVERFTSREEFLAKAAPPTPSGLMSPGRTAIQVTRRPWGIIHDRDPTISPKIATLPPVFLDELFMHRLDAKGEGGYDVLPHPYK